MAFDFRLISIVFSNENQTVVARHAAIDCLGQVSHAAFRKSISESLDHAANRRGLSMTSPHIVEKIDVGNVSIG
jgi:hypothetical protein